MSGSVKGWCPGALRPMQTGDGLVLRVRPHGARLTVAQATGLADLAETCGNGLIDLGSRAHLQLRGIRAEALPQAWRVLADLGLIDPDPATEARRNILTTPVWQEAETLAIVTALEAALTGAPDLPAKFGFAVDTGTRAVLGAASADIRIERAATGLILRADGMPGGVPVTAGDAPVRAIALAHWFAVHRGTQTRMAGLVAAGFHPDGTVLPLTGPELAPGPTPFGACRALPFGQMTAATLRVLAQAPLRLTPWRSVVVEGLADLPGAPGLIADPRDPLLRVAACTGAPGCTTAEGETRTLARALAPLVPEGAVLHVSGCAKGCAHPKPAWRTVTARAGRYELTDGTTMIPGLAAEDIPDLLRGPLAP